MSKQRFGDSMTAVNDWGIPDESQATTATAEPVQETLVPAFVSSPQWGFTLYDSRRRKVNSTEEGTPPYTFMAHYCDVTMPDTW